MVRGPARRDLGDARAMPMPPSAKSSRQAAARAATSISSANAARSGLRAVRRGPRPCPRQVPRTGRSGWRAAVPDPVRPGIRSTWWWRSTSSSTSRMTSDALRSLVSMARPGGRVSGHGAGDPEPLGLPRSSASPRPPLRRGPPEAHLSLVRGIHRLPDLLQYGARPDRHRVPIGRAVQRSESREPGADAAEPINRLLAKTFSVERQADPSDTVPVRLSLGVILVKD